MKLADLELNELEETYVEQNITRAAQEKIAQAIADEFLKTRCAKEVYNKVKAGIDPDEIRDRVQCHIVEGIVQNWAERRCGNE